MTEKEREIWHDNKTKECEREGRPDSCNEAKWAFNDKLKHESCKTCWRSGYYFHYACQLVGINTSLVEDKSQMKNLWYIGSAIVKFDIPEGYDAKAYKRGKISPEEFIAQVKPILTINPKLMPDDYTLEDLIANYSDGFEFVVQNEDIL